MRGMINRNWLPRGWLLAEIVMALLLIPLPAEPQQQPLASTTSVDQSKAAENSGNNSNTPAKDKQESGATNDRLFLLCPTS